MTDPPEITVLILGDVGVGKTTFLSRVSRGAFIDTSSRSETTSHDQEEPYTFDITLSQRPHRLLFYTLSSATPDTSIFPSLLIFCYDVASRISLMNVQQHYNKETTYADIPTLLLSLKRDLRSSKPLSEIIDPQEGYRIAQEMRCDGYLECSALTGELVSEVWEDVCKAAVGTLKTGGEGGGCAVC